MTLDTSTSQKWQFRNNLSQTNGVPTPSASTEPAGPSQPLDPGAATDPRVARTHDTVCAVVLDLIAREGHHAVTLARVAAESGVGRSTLYRHWPDVRTLLLDAVSRPDNEEPPPLFGDLRLDLAVDLHRLRLVFDDRRLVALIVSLLEQAEFDDAFATALRDHQAAHTDRLRAVLESARATGQLRGPGEIDTDHALALLAGPLFFRRLVTGQTVTPEFVDTVLDTFLRGIEEATDPSTARSPELHS